MLLPTAIPPNDPTHLAELHYYRSTRPRNISLELLLKELSMNSEIWTRRSPTQSSHLWRLLWALNGRPKSQLSDQISANAIWSALVNVYTVRALPNTWIMVHVRACTGKRKQPRQVFFSLLSVPKCTPVWTPIQNPPRLCFLALWLVLSHKE